MPGTRLAVLAIIVVISCIGRTARAAEAGLIARFVYLKQGLAALLVFAGAKILVSDVYKLPIPITLAVIVGVLAVSIAASLFATRHTSEDDEHDDSAGGLVPHAGITREGVA